MIDIIRLKGAPILIPLIVGIFFYNRLDKDIKYVFYFVAFGTLIEICHFVLVQMGSKNTTFLAHIYQLFAFVFLGFFYKQVFKNLISEIVPLTIIVMFGIYSIINMLFLQSLMEYPSLQGALLRIVFLFASIAFFLKTMVEAKIERLWDEPLIWINCAILIYYASSLFYSILFNLILDYSREFSGLIGWYFASSNALFYVLLAVGFWMAGKHKTKIKLFHSK